MSRRQKRGGVANFWSFRECDLVPIIVKRRREERGPGVVTLAALLAKMIRLFQSVRCRLGCASLSREVHNFDGTIRQNLYRYIEKERDKVSQQIKDRYAIASVPNRKKAKKVNMDALYGITGESSWREYFNSNFENSSNTRFW